MCTCLNACWFNAQSRFDLQNRYGRPRESRVATQKDVQRVSREKSVKQHLITIISSFTVHASGHISTLREAGALDIRLIAALPAVDIRDATAPGMSRAT